MDSHNWQYVSFLSIFDHWLTIEEAENCKIFEHFIAKKYGYLDEYLTGEQKFIQFYKSLDTNVKVLKKPKMPVISTDSKNFNRLLNKHLLHGKNFDLFFPNQQILAEIGFDRTDVIFTKDKESLNHVHTLSEKCGLFIIETINYQDYQKSFERF